MRQRAHIHISHATRLLKVKRAYCIPRVPLSPTPLIPVKLGHAQVAALMAVNPEKGDHPQLPRVPWFRRLALDVTSSEWDILALSTAFKLLLFPA